MNMQVFFDQLSEALITKNWPLFVEHFSFPFVLSTREGTEIFLTEIDLVRVAKLYAEAMDAQSVSALCAEVAAIELPKADQQRIWLESYHVSKSLGTVHRSSSTVFCRTLPGGAVKIEMMEYAERAFPHVLPIYQRAMSA
ncbi:MAG: hypothetical protein AAGD04_06460 [Pseudomonadota bacterium]